MHRLQVLKTMYFNTCNVTSIIIQNARAYLNMKSFICCSFFCGYTRDEWNIYRKEKEDICLR